MMYREDRRKVKPAAGGRERARIGGIGAVTSHVLYSLPSGHAFATNDV